MIEALKLKVCSDSGTMITRIDLFSYGKGQTWEVGVEKPFPSMIRFDWMQDLLEWFDWYLKGEGRQPGLHVEIQSNQGSWRIEDRYPASDTVRGCNDTRGRSQRISGGQNVLPDGSTGPVYESAPLESDMYLQGLPRLHVEVSTTTGWAIVRIA